MLRKKNVLFKVMGSTEMGLGHINRCLTLVRSLPKSWRATIMVNNDPLVEQFLGNIDLSSDTGLGVEVLLESQIDCYKSSVDLLIFDQLGKNRSLLKALKEEFNCVVVAMDYFDYESEEVDIVINLFNQASEDSPSYGRIKCYEGLQFSIISQQFEAFKNKSIHLKENIQQVFILMGGGDAEMKTCEALELFKEVGPEVSIDVVIGPLCPHEGAIRLVAAQLSQTVEIYKSPNNIPELMAKADVAISGCATTFFELSFLGVPAIVLSQNMLENRFCHFLESQGLALYGKESLQSSWRKIARLEQRQDLVKTQMETFDGQGARRVLDAAGIPAPTNIIAA